MRFFLGSINDEEGIEENSDSENETPKDNAK